MAEKLENNGIEIKLVNTPDSLQALSTILKSRTEFGFDTEFDRFCREYGFKLFLLQIFDGNICYLVDPLACKDLSPLWEAFEDPQICKVVYSSSEDVQLLKLNGCNIKNVYDLQIAAKLCNYDANSFSDIIKLMFNVTLDKSLQRSNWRPRPLSSAQQIYASHDVIWLLQLKSIFEKTALKNSVTPIIEEENKYCENVPVTSYVVKLSAKQKASFSAYHQKVLLNLLHIRNKIAEAYNMPPFYIVADATLEEIVINKKNFMSEPFKKGFCSRLVNDETFKMLFLNEIDTIDETIENIPAKRTYDNTIERKFYNAPSKEIVEENCKKLQHALQAEYGPNAAEFILRGLKKSLMQMPFNEIKLRDYQQEIITTTSKNLNIAL